MNYLELDISKRILQIVYRFDGQYSWYGILRFGEQYADVEKTLPTFEVLKKLTKDGYIRTVQMENNLEKYFITEKGRRELEATESN